MKKVLQSSIFIITAALLVACGGGDSIEAKQQQLEKYKSEIRDLQGKVALLEEELQAAGINMEEKKAEILVATMPIKTQKFLHQVEVRGSVQSRKNVLISAETMGRVERVLVSEGQEVAKGQTLLIMDADILRNNISEVETSLELAEAVFTRQKNLWDQKIGTEIQYLQAKNNRDALQKRLKTLESQLRQYSVVAPFAGIIDDVIVKVGEMAQPGLPVARILNPADMYIKADVSEAYLGKFSIGDKTSIYFPVQERTYQATISSVSKVINEQNRTFVVEVALPRSDFDYQPNQVAILKLTDYQNEEALTVPTRLIQKDAEGKFVFVVGNEQGKKVAMKKRVSTGLSYNSRTEILDGLSTGDQIIEKGFRDVNEGTEIKLAAL